jgi:methionyl-tRNA formyltransferase
VRILCCLNRDLASNVALNLLLPSLARHEVRVALTESVGKTHAVESEPPERTQLRLLEQRLPNEILFPLIERANLHDDAARHLTFAEIERHRGIRIDSLSNPNAAAGLDAVRAFAPDLILTIRYGAILKAPVIAIPRLGVLNLHSGVLPNYRGVLATFRALLNGDRHVGCTLHYIRDATIDTGDVVQISRIAVDSRRSLLWHVLALYPAGIDMIAAALDRLANGAALESTAQPPSSGSYYTYPTAEEWATFAQRGWQVAQIQDLLDVLQRYLPVGTTAPIIDPG